MLFCPAFFISTRALALGVLLAVLSGSVTGTVLAQSTPPDSVRRAALEDFHGPDLTGKDGPLAKAGLDLLLLYHQRNSGADRSSSIRSEDEPTGARRGGLQIQDGRVVIDAVAAGDVGALAADLDSLGMTNGATAGGLVSGRFPIAKIPALARLETLRGVQPARARTRSGTSAPPSTQTRPSQPSSANRPAPTETPAAPSENPTPGETSATGNLPAPAPDSSSDSRARPSAPAPSSSSEERAVASTDPSSEAPSMALWGVLALISIVLFLEER